MKKFGFILFSLGVGFLFAQEKARVPLKVIPTEAAPQASVAERTLHSSAPSPKDYTESQINAAVQAWNSPVREQREAASQFLKTWVESKPTQAKIRFLRLLREAPQPEARERSARLLRIIAAAEFDTTGVGFIGVSLSPTGMSIKHPKENSTLIGLPITAVSPSSAAEKSGMKAGDIVVSVDDFRWDEVDQIIDADHGLSAKIRAKGAGTTVIFGLMRDAQLLKVHVTLRRRPTNLDRLPIDGFNFNGAQGGMQLGLVQGPQWDKKMIDDLVAEEKNSPEYFQEWLKLQEQSPTAK